MAEPVFIVRNSAGAVTFDSRVAVAGCVGSLVEVPVSTAVTYTYPNHAGRTAVVLDVGGRRLSGITIDYALGYPRVAFASSAGLRMVAIWLV